jgi:3'-phosphoadenosine 5'-phosphosulfate (PAPS) 3'-phosphatase
MPAWDDELVVAVAAARAAGAAAKRLQAGVESQGKADGSPVTAGDLAADAAIAEVLGRAFPGDAILSEEVVGDGSRHAARRVWIVDPIDGTRGYADGGGEWAVHLALAVEGRLALGVLDLPSLGLTVWGVPGQGVWVDRGGGAEILRPRPVAAPVLAASASSRNQRHFARIRACLPEFGWLAAHSVGYKVWQMLDGQADLFVHPRWIAEWDVAAPAAVLLAAGGSATGLDGGAYRFNGPYARSPGLVFSRRDDHAGIVQRLALGGVTLGGVVL